MQRTLSRPGAGWLAWLVVFALFFSAVAPALAAVAQAGVGSGAWIEVCTANGIERLPLDAADSDEEAVSGAPDCMWCSLHAGMPALLPPCKGLPAEAARGAVPLPSVFDVFHGARGCAIAQPRAPPVFS